MLLIFHSLTLCVYKLCILLAHRTLRSLISSPNPFKRGNGEDCIILPHFYSSTKRNNQRASSVECSFPQTKIVIRISTFKRLLNKLQWIQRARIMSVSCKTRSLARMYYRFSMRLSLLSLRHVPQLNCTIIPLELIAKLTSNMSRIYVVQRDVCAM